MAENKCPACGSEKYRRVDLCFDCDHKQFVVPLERQRETDTPTWRWKERGKNARG